MMEACSGECVGIGMQVGNLNLVRFTFVLRVIEWIRI